MFHAAVLTWLVFRAGSLPLLGRYVVELLNFEAPEAITVGMLVAGGIILFGWLAQYAGEREDVVQAFLRLPASLQGAVYAIAWVVIMVFNTAGPRPIIYFRF